MIEREKTWFRRNWKWVVPVGCLTIIVGLGALAGGIFWMIFGMFRSSAVYEEALASARASSALVEQIGEPIETGWFVTGSMSTSGSSGSANMSIPISGPRGKATIYVQAEQSGGVWSYQSLIVRIDETGERIDLLTTGDQGNLSTPREQRAHPASGTKILTESGTEKSLIG